MQDQYWPDEDDSTPDELSDQFWPEPVFDNPWDDYDADPISDIRSFMAKTAAAYRASYVVTARKVGKAAMGYDLHKSLAAHKHDVHVHIPLDPELIQARTGCATARVMPIVRRGTGPPIEPFKKRGRK